MKQSKKNTHCPGVFIYAIVIAICYMHTAHAQGVALYPIPEKIEGKLAATKIYVSCKSEKMLKPASEALGQAAIATAESAPRGE